MSRRRIYIVEDEALLAMELEDHLTSLGYEVCGRAARGDVALAEIPEAAPDLVLLDINLGPGLSGLDIAEALLAEHVDVPVIFLTAYSESHLVSRVIGSRSFGYIVKPLVPGSLKANIELALDKHDLELELRRAVSRAESAEAEIREQTATLQRVVEHVSDGLLVEDRAGRIAFANGRVAVMHGVPRDRLAELRFADLVDPAWHPLLDARQPTGADEAPATFAYRARRGDGSMFWAEANRVPIRDEEGELFGVQSTIRDISERKATEDALWFLSTGVAHLRGDALVAELAHELVRLLDVDVAFVGAYAPGQRAARTIALWLDGRSHACDALDLSALPLDSDDDALTKAALRGPGLISGLAFEDAALTHLVASGGQRIGVLGVLSRRPLPRGPRARALLGIFAVRAGAAIEQQSDQQRFRDLFDFSADGVLMVARDGAIVMANRRAYELLGHELASESLVGLGVESLIPGELRHRHADHRRHYHERPVPRMIGTLDAPLVALRADGTQVPVDISLGPFSTHDGELVVVSLRDMTRHIRAAEERTSLELQLRQAQKMEALGTLASGIAHDFNNILTALVANAELARHDLDASHPARPPLEAVSAAAERATHLVRQILAFSRRQAPQRSRTSLAPIVHEAVRLLRATLPARITLAVEVAEETPIVSVDVTQIHQVLMNLGTNASHAISAPRGVIAVQLDGGRRGGPSGPGYARLVVRDNGCGMDRETLERALEPFFTTKPAGRGSGLGLSVVHGIVAEHDGEMTIVSAPGVGTTVTILLPAEVAATASGDTSPPSASTFLPGDGLRILFIDDDPMLTTVGEALLRRLGYEVRLMTDPTDALAAIADDPDAYDAVITDYNMPSLSGTEVASQIKVIAPDLPVVLASGHIGLSDEELRAAGVRFRLDKPYDLNAIDRVLRDVRMTDSTSSESSPTFAKDASATERSR